MEQVLVSFHTSSCFTRFGLGKVHEARLSQPPPPPPPVEEEGVEEGGEEGKVEGRPDIDLTHWGFRYDPSITLCNENSPHVTVCYIILYFVIHTTNQSNHGLCIVTNA